MADKIKSLSVFFCFLPYLYVLVKSPGQVQAWAHVLAFLALLVNFKGVVRVPRREIPIMLLPLFFFTFPYTLDVETYGLILQKSGGFVLGLFVYYMAKGCRLDSAPLLLLIASSAYLLVGITQIYSTSLYLTIGELFFSTRHAIVGLRGVSSIAPEATDLGYTVAVLLFTAYLLFRQYGQRMYLMPATLSLILLLFMSASGAGFFAVCALFAPLLLFSKLNILLRLSALLTALVIIMNLEGIRGIELLRLVIEDPGALIDTSLAHRAVHNYVAFFALLETGYGFGGGSFVHEAPRLFDYLGVGVILDLNGHYREAVGITLGKHALSMFSLLIFEYGLMGVAYLVSMSYLIIASKCTYKISLFLLFIMTWGQSFPSAYPLFWLLLGIAYNPRYPRLSGIVAVQRD